MADLGKRWLTETDRDLWRETVDMIQAGDSRVSHDTGELGGIVDSYIRARGGNVTPEQYTEHHRQEEREARIKPKIRVLRVT